MTTLEPLLTTLGYTEPAQQRAFVQLLQVTGCFGNIPGQSETISDRQADLLLKHLTFGSNEEAVEWLHGATQSQWLQRKAGQERWEVENTQELKAKEPAIRAAVQKLGLFEATAPKHQHYEHVLLLGATEPVVNERLKSVRQLAQGGITFDKLYLLGSERPLVPSREPSAIKILQEQPGAATEMTMMIQRTQAMAENWPQDLAMQATITAIDTLRKDGARANTQDTIESWLLHKPQPGRVLAISSAPYTHYQKAAIESMLPEGMQLEMAAPATHPLNISAPIVLDTLAREINASLPFLTHQKKRAEAKTQTLPVDVFNHQELVHVSDIRHDPERFQFRLNTSESGIREDTMIKGEFNPLLHGKSVLLYEQNDGKRFVVDGHNRVECAQRSGQDIVLPARILREKDGVSAQDAKIIGAYVNMAKEFTCPAITQKPNAMLEATLVFHDVEMGKVNTALLPELPAMEALETARAAASLSEPAFKHVKEGAVPVFMAAEVARRVKAPQEQAQVMEILDQRLNASSWRERVSAEPAVGLAR